MMKQFVFILVSILGFYANSAYTQNADDEVSIMLAASRCDLLTVRRWIFSGASDDSTDEHGNTVLKYAVESNCGELFEFLLSSGANVNAKAKHGGGTALMIAASKGRAEFTTRLLAAGAEINLKNG